MFNSFATETRYNSNIVATLDILNHLIPLIEDFFILLDKSLHTNNQQFIEYIKYLDSLGLDGTSLASPHVSLNLFLTLYLTI